MKQVGILGLAGSGKTTLFEILMLGAGASVQAAAGREHLGVVEVPDGRVDKLSALYQPKKTTHSRIQFVDSAAPGHVKTRPPGKASDPFSSVRNCDALAVVLRDFENPAVPIEGGIDPARDLRSVETELFLSDLAIVEARLERIDKDLRVGKRRDESERDVLMRSRELLESERPLRAEPFDAAEEKLLRGFQLLSGKPMLVVVNRDDRPSQPLPHVGPGSLAVGLRARLEREILALAPEDREAFRAELGAEEDGLSLVIRGCYQLMGLLSFFTVGPEEVRAWDLRRGQTAIDAAGEVHSDFARSFIRAEVIPWNELVAAGGTAGARSKGIVRLEGREYEVKDGDCLEIRFGK